MRFLILFLLLFVVSVGAQEELEEVSIEFASNEYGSGETLQARIHYSVELVGSVEANNIKLVDGLGVEIPVAVVLMDVGVNDSYVYFDVPSLDPGNYTLVIKDVVFFRDGVLVQEDFEKGFVVVSKEVIVSIFPGAFKIDNIFSDTNFNLRVSSLNVLDVDLSSSDFIAMKPLSFTLRDFEDVKVFVDLSGSFSEGSIDVTYEGGSYKIPVFTPGSFEEEEVVVDENVSFEVSFLDITEINRELEKERSIDGEILIGNTGVGNLTNLVFSLDDSLKDVVRLNISEINLLESGSSVGQYLWINENSVVGEYSGNMTLENNEVSLVFPIYVKVLEEEEVEVEPVVNETEVDDGDDDIPVDIPPLNGGGGEEEGSLWWLWLIFVVVIILSIGGGYLFYLKRNKPGEFEDFLDGLRGR